MARCSSSHVRTGSRASGTTAQVRIRPSLDVAINPASSSTERCRITVGRRSPVGPARSVTRAGPSASRVRIDRRVGSARAWKSSERSGSCLAMTLTIACPAARRKGKLRQSAKFFSAGQDEWLRAVQLCYRTRLEGRSQRCSHWPDVRNRRTKRRLALHRNSNFIRYRVPTLGGGSLQLTRGPAKKDQQSQWQKTCVEFA